MKWKPTAFKLDAKGLVRAIFGEQTDEALLLEAASQGKIDLYADSTSWNAVLWLIMSTIKNEHHQPIYSGEKLGKLRDSLPITFLQ
ncbi:MAG: hypothetical protein CMB51_05375 [Euryarchaeota archaeon]|jgi:hypothetical protein|nr:hypothetical protein [Euryarchaeota archaeon]MED5350823.1 hypothetical protein [Candidatus Thermoplasmatota archaeon]DAC15173.1 MAG TPA: hypothetical protein D7I06_07445 [Candidatus Poseidoniales archaeon]HII63423.1 hypothetical protein [Candidatus Poseidoniaceae archaeon]MAN06837.1 hypothetical protein [Euryarchaeota archaeon]|tara:strand:+ start:2644 stop:2901 length:258 start_codon:yes stop_codon:yes gene_type:complete